MSPASIDRLREILTDIADRLDAEALELRTKHPRSAAAVRTQSAKVRALAASLPEPTQPITL